MSGNFHKPLSFFEEPKEASGLRCPLVPGLSAFPVIAWATLLVSACGG